MNDQAKNSKDQDATVEAALPAAPVLTTGTNSRLLVTKAVLWFLVGVACVVAVVRYAKGLGATTSLTDITPWGMWIGFDVLAGVALAAGGFVLAGTFYIFGRERYHGIVRPAVLTAFLGYLAVILGLLVDLGRPYNIWRMMVNWNPHSPLFEVGMCVMLYTTVLALEFAPVGLERFGWAGGIVRLLRKLTIPLVIIGIALSSLHQSSLGTLFLLAEGRMHPLWYSPILPLMFLISAIALGLAMVSLEGVITSWLYKRKPEWPQLGGLTRAAAVVLGVYLLVRLGDLIVRGQIGNAFAASGFATLFWVEISMSAIAPILLLSLPQTRGRPWAISWGAFLTVAGLILHRADVGGISHIAVTGETYLPALAEVCISVGIVCGLGLIFLFFVENLKVWEAPPVRADHFTPPAIDPVSWQFIRGPWFGAGQRAALAWIAGAVVGLAIMEAQLAIRADSTAQPIQSPLNVLVERSPRADGPGHSFRLVQPSEASLQAALPGGPDRARFATTTDGGQVEPALLIDSGGAGRFVLFGHDAHQERLGGKNSCLVCHHRNVPLDQGTSCTHCHQDMYRTTDTFDHARHVTAHGEKASCAVCHADPSVAKDRLSSKSCDSCHQRAPAEVSRVRVTRQLDPGLAPGYQTALHGLCIDCHREQEQEVGAEQPHLSECAACHRHDFRDEGMLRKQFGATPGTTARMAPGKNSQQTALVQP